MERKEQHMGINYLVDEEGRTTAVVVPIAEWEALREESLSPEELAQAEAGWQDYLAGRSKPLEQVIREMGEAGNDHVDS
jgi:hypothetical protein